MAFTNNNEPLKNIAAGLSYLSNLTGSFFYSFIPAKDIFVDLAAQVFGQSFLGLSYFSTAATGYYSLEDSYFEIALRALAADYEYFEEDNSCDIIYQIINSKKED